MLPKNPYSASQEALVVGLARTGDRAAFSELVQRRQSWVRTLMRRCSNDVNLADDLAQQIFLQAWRDIGRLREPKLFGAWLKKLAINTWLKHQRKNDPLKSADEHDGTESQTRDTPAVAMDLDRALAKLNYTVRLCVVLSCHEGMSHSAIATLTDLPLGTVKSHIRRGTQQLQNLLSAYVAEPGEST